MPRLEGDTLSGRKAVLPDGARGRVALAAMGFTYDSRFAVEAWGNWFRSEFGTREGVTFFEIPMMGRAARLGRVFIDRGMRSNTPKELHDHVITVYGDTSAWKARTGYADARRKEAYLVLVDKEGVVQWVHHGPFDEAVTSSLRATVEALIRR